MPSHRIRIQMLMERQTSFDGFPSWCYRWYKIWFSVRSLNWRLKLGNVIQSLVNRSAFFLGLVMVDFRMERVCGIILFHLFLEGSPFCLYFVHEVVLRFKKLLESPFFLAAFIDCRFEGALFEYSAFFFFLFGFYFFFFLFFVFGAALYDGWGSGSFGLGVWCFVFVEDVIEVYVCPWGGGEVFESCGDCSYWYSLANEFVVKVLLHLTI